MAHDRLGYRHERAGWAVITTLSSQQLLDARLRLDCARCTQLYYPAKFGRTFFIHVAFAALVFLRGRGRMAGFRLAKPRQLGAALAQGCQQ